MNPGGAGTDDVWGEEQKDDNSLYLILSEQFWKEE